MPNSRPSVGRPNLREWSLRVVSSADARPNMRRITFTADDIADFTYRPGQDVVFLIPLEDGTQGRRHYTIRSFAKEAGTFDVDFLLHGDTPAPNWARGAKPGDTIVARGPRGRNVFDPQADWHLFTGDETCIPAIAHILETMPAAHRAFVFVETGGPEGEIEFATSADATIRWLHRRGPAGPSHLMLEELEGFSLPEGRGRALIIGETSNVRRQRHALVRRGFAKEQISSEGYWRPGRVGGHDHVED